MLRFENHPVTIAHINVRPEFHGEDEVTVLDLKLTTDLANTALDRASHTLREAIFEAEEGGDLLGAGEHLPHVKNPELGTLHWKGEYSATVRLITGPKEKDVIEIEGATLDKIAIEPKEGGSCAFTFRVRIEPDEKLAASLMMLLRHEVRASISTEEDETE